MSFYSDYQREIKRNAKRGRCLHFDSGTRCDAIVAAHSIQKSGQLQLIAENGHVYRLNADPSTLRDTNGMPIPKTIGLNKASTFAGFCKTHDNELFLPIDDSVLIPDHQQIALYAYRCICREYFVKENAVNLLEKMTAHPDLKPGQSKFLRSSQVGHSLGFSGLKFHKAKYDDAIRERNFHQFEFAVFISNSECTLQLSGLLYPDYDFCGNPIQDLGNWTDPLELLTFFTAPTSDGWAFCFGWHESSNNSCEQLIRSLAHIVSNGESVEDALLRFSFSCCENHAFRISWWDSLSEFDQKVLMDRMNLMAAPNIAVPANYLSVGCEGIATWEFKHVLTTMPADA